MSVPQLFSDKVALIVGGGSGIGAACARRLALGGAKVLIVDLSGDAARRVADMLGGEAFEADIASDSAVADLAAEIDSRSINLDMLINCAAAFQAPVAPDTLKMERWDLVADVSLRGTYLSCAAFGSGMVRRGFGSIVNIASVAGMCSLPMHSYGPAKAGVISLSASLAAEWGPRGVRVNAVSPGFTLTPTLQAAIAHTPRTEVDILASTPLGRFVDPEDVAEAVSFLSSPSAAAITGINLPVDCGWLSGVTWQAYGGLRTVTD